MHLKICFKHLFLFHLSVNEPVISITVLDLRNPDPAFDMF